jgi:hypothetical protein
MLLIFLAFLVVLLFCLSSFCVLCSMLTVSLHCPYLSVLCSMLTVSLHCPFLIVTPSGKIKSRRTCYR